MLGWDEERSRRSVAPRRTEVTQETEEAQPRPFEEDLRLARAALRGDSAARAEFAGRMEFVSRYLNAENQRLGRPLSSDELRDLRQDVLLSVWKKLGSYEGRAALRTWVFPFCSLGLRRWLSKRQRRKGIVVPLWDEALDGLSGSHRSSPEEGKETLFSLLRHLSPREAQIVRLKVLECLEFGEIARQLKLSKSSVKTPYYRSLLKLQQVLQSGGERNGC